VAAAKSGQFDHTAQRLRDNRAEAAAHRGGHRDPDRHRSDRGGPARLRPPVKRLHDLSHDGEPLTEEAHAQCPGHAAYIGSEWVYPEDEASIDPDGEDDDQDNDEAGEAARPSRAWVRSTSPPTRRPTATPTGKAATAPGADGRRRRDDRGGAGSSPRPTADVKWWAQGGDVRGVIRLVGDGTEYTDIRVSADRPALVLAVAQAIGAQLGTSTSQRPGPTRDTSSPPDLLPLAGWRPMWATLDGAPVFAGYWDDSRPLWNGWLSPGGSLWPACARSPLGRNRPCVRTARTRT
jgi:hypothetical protein